MYKSEEEKTRENNEVRYIAAYTILKKMLESKLISNDVFERINLKMAEKQNCIAFSS